MAILTDAEIATLFSKCSYSEFTEIEQSQLTLAKEQTLGIIALVLNLQDFSEQMTRTVYLPVDTTFQHNRHETVADFDGNDAYPALILRHTPVIVTGLRVWEDKDANAGQNETDFAEITELDIGEDFWLDVGRNTSGGVGISDSGILYRKTQWSTRPGTIKVTYTGGPAVSTLGAYWANLRRAYSLVLKDIFYALKRETQAGFNTGIVKTGESIGKYSYNGKSASEVSGGMGFSIVGSNVQSDVYELLSPLINIEF
jgi:hypothetical protein